MFTNNNNNNSNANGDRQQQQLNHGRSGPAPSAPSSASNHQTTEPILNTLLEKAANIERATNIIMIGAAIKEALKEQCRNERDLRQKTITFNITDKASGDAVIDCIMAWVSLSMSGPPSFRQARDKLYAQMASIRDKEALIDYIKLSQPDTLLSQTLSKPPPNWLYFERLPVKLEINNLPESVQIGKVRDTLQSVIQHNSNAHIIAIKDGKTHAKTKKRTVSLRVNGEAFYHFIIQMNGIVPLMDGRLKTNLYFRINCRPWQYGDCHTIGFRLTCPGKLCANCGATDHQARACSKRTEYCKNCTKPGHRAEDNHCPKFLVEVAKEIRKHDFPIEVLTDSEMISALIEQIQLS